MSVSMPSKAAIAVLVAGSLCACTVAKRDTFDEASADQQAYEEPTFDTSRPQTYKPTGSKIVERRDGSRRRSPENSSSAPVRDLENAPAVTVIQNQPPK
jgi:hypothetical protein